MDRINEYRQIAIEFLEDFAKNDANTQLIFDRSHDRYLVMHNEWRDEYRIYGCAIQLDIIEGQIWIQHNSTEIYIVGEASPVENRELIQRGVAPKDIILGFRSPSVRQLLATVHD
jgi:XisI protein